MSLQAYATWCFDCIRRYSINKTIKTSSYVHHFLPHCYALPVCGDFIYFVQVCPIQPVGIFLRPEDFQPMGTASLEIFEPLGSKPGCHLNLHLGRFPTLGISTRPEVFQHLGFDSPSSSHGKLSDQWFSIPLELSLANEDLRPVNCQLSNLRKISIRLEELSNQGKIFTIDWVLGVQS